MRRFKDGGISVCFHCQRQLVRIKGGFIFAEIIDPDGHRLRVHKECQEPAQGHGYRIPPKVWLTTDPEAPQPNEMVSC